jgi:hypothetical protein
MTESQCEFWMDMHEEGATLPLDVIVALTNEGYILNQDEEV